MKRMIIRLVLAMAILASSLFTAGAQAADWGVGLITYYAWWQPSFMSGYDDLEMTPAFLYGPAATVSFLERWSLSLSCVQNFGLSPEVSFTSNFTGSLGPGRVESAGEYTIVQLDAAIGFTLNDFATLFAGYKVFTGTIAIDDSVISSGGYTWYNHENKPSMEFFSHCAAIGGILRYSLFEGGSISLNLSLLYVYSTLKLSVVSEVSTALTQIHYDSPGGSEKVNASGLGGNAVLAFTYFIEPLSTAVSLGGRFQYVTYYNNSDVAMDDEMVYGIMLTAMFLF